MKISCSKEHIQKENEDGYLVDSVAVECSRCGERTESYGTGGRSTKRCLTLLNERCPQGENNYYEISSGNRRQREGDGQCDESCEDTTQLGAELLVLGEIWDEKTTGVDAIYCPGCSEVLVGIGWEGTITCFETVCDGCGLALFAFGVVCSTNEYYSEHGAPTAGALRDCVTAYWEQQLEEGVIMEHQRGPRGDRTVENDMTEHFAKEYQRLADGWGWNWEAAQAMEGDE